MDAITSKSQASLEDHREDEDDSGAHEEPIDDNEMSEPERIDIRPTVNRTLPCRATTGKSFAIPFRPPPRKTHYSSLIASRSTTTASGASTSYYGINIHAIIDETAAKRTNDAITAEAHIGAVHPSIEAPVEPGKSTGKRQTIKQHMWTEKYRARKFTDLIGDERTHRSVLRWLKAWDSIVFPSSQRRPSGPPKLHHQSSSFSSSSFSSSNPNAAADKPHRKILLLTGPPGLGKTTLAHVCAKQAGYEVQEINASDERSASVIKNRIRDMCGTENVRPINSTSDSSKTRKAAKPVCIVVDEVDGVTSSSGAGGGEGGFVKALLDLLALDAKNNRNSTASTTSTTKRKGDSFRLLRPIILIANDGYHPSLKLLRQPSAQTSHQPPAELIHVRAPPLNRLIPRIASIFAAETIPCDADAVRALCETTWGITSFKESKSSSSNVGGSEGDIRSILVTAEWVALKFRNFCQTSPKPTRLTKHWLEAHVIPSLASGANSSRTLARCNAREVAERIFLHNAGFPSPPPPKPTSTSKTSSTASKTSSQTTSSTTAAHTHLTRLRELIEATADDERIATEIFTSYPNQPFSDDTLLSKPNAAHDWLHFHDLLSHSVHSQQSWELAPYLSYPILGCHHLFASPRSSSLTHQNTYTHRAEDQEAEKAHPLTTPSASRTATELTKLNSTTLTDLRPSLSLALQRSFPSPSSLITDLIPFLLRILVPDIKPVIIGSERSVASVRRSEERDRVRRAVDAMVACGISFEKTRVEDASIGGAETWKTGYAKESVYRMVPPVDELGVFGTLDRVGTGMGLGGNGAQKVRYATRQVLAQEYEREVQRLSVRAASRRSGGLASEVAATKKGGSLSTSSMSDGVGPKLLDVVPEKEKGVKRDFFGRPVATLAKQSSSVDIGAEGETETESQGGEGTVAHKRKKSVGKNGLPEGTKAITMKDLLEAY